MAKVIEIYLAGQTFLDKEVGDFRFIIHTGNRPGGEDSEPAIILEGETSKKNKGAGEDSKFIIEMENLKPPYVALKWADEKYLNVEKEE